MRTGGVVAAAFVLAGLLVLAVRLPLASPADGRSAQGEARTVVAKFFATINSRRFDETCDLLSERFYRLNHVPSKARCVLGLRIGFTWAPSYHFTIIGVRLDGNRTVVRAVADGVPGTVVLVREKGALKVLELR